MTKYTEHREALVPIMQPAPPSGRMQNHTLQQREEGTNPSFLSTETCRYLGPTTGPLPTVHCWQSTMHCPDSANGGKDGPRVMKGRRFKVTVVLLNMTSFLVSATHYLF